MSYIKANGMRAAIRFNSQEVAENFQSWLPEKVDSTQDNIHVWFHFERDRRLMKRVCTKLGRLSQHIEVKTVKYTVHRRG